MRSSILCFFAVLGLVLSAPIDDVTDISTTENDGFPLCDPTQAAGCASTPNDSQISSTYSPPAGLNSVESQLAPSAVTGVEGSDISNQNSEPPDMTVAFNSDTQSSGIDNSVPQVIASDQDSLGSSKNVPVIAPADIQVWNCDDFSKTDKGICSTCMHKLCQEAALEVSCTPGDQHCVACQLTDGACGAVFKTTRKALGHLPSSNNPNRQDWCFNSDCARTEKSSVEIPTGKPGENPDKIPEEKPGQIQGKNPTQKPGKDSCLWEVSGFCILGP